MSTIKSTRMMTVVVVALLFIVGYQPAGFAEPWMFSFLDTGTATDDTSSPADTAGDSGSPEDPTDDTSTPVDPTDDTSTPADPSDDTGTPPDTGDDTGSVPEPGDTGDTGEVMDGVDGEDTGPSGQSAAELAGEKGGCGCAVGASPASGLVWVGALFFGLLRRRS